MRATRKLLDRLGPPTSPVEQASTTLLGDWYVTAWFWRPQVALLVSGVTLLPVLMPMAPAATLLQRLGSQLAAVLDAHGTPAEFIEAELQEMDEVRLARTASRSVVGIMNEFTYLADAWRQDEPDLLALAVRLAATPCGPLYKRHISPDRELAALVVAQLCSALSRQEHVCDQTGIFHDRGRSGNCSTGCCRPGRLMAWDWWYGLPAGRCSAVARRLRSDLRWPGRWARLTRIGLTRC